MVSLLDIIGPVMVGPSSSHTAGACRIALVARALCCGTPERARIELHGSFARTGKGHGTDRALVGGLLGFAPDDARLRASLELAAGLGLLATIETTRLRGAHHPNTARLTLERAGRSVQLVGSSLGGGRIAVTEIDGFALDLSGAYDTLIVEARDAPGVVAAVTAELAAAKVNVAGMRVSRHRKGGDAIHVYELDAPADEAALASIRALAAVAFLRVVPRVD
ncbi:MAG: L-serine ammonia-lyase, iron-sulfur-dependent, subunit beta [Myxococcales bacterium]|nr:L-serine ammonia-lyase, iron-sulfur-dependent, subunit beta [Myxococcales bacterium]